MIPNEHRCHRGLPADEVNRIRQVETGDLRHAFGKENKPSRIVLVVTAINAIEAGAVEILLPLDEPQLHASGTGGLPDLAGQIFRTDRDRELRLGAFRPQSLVFPDAAEEWENDGDLVTSSSKVGRQSLNKIRKPPGI